MDPDIDVDITEARRRHGAGTPWIDVREADEWQLAHIEGTSHHPLRGVLESVTREFPDPGTPLLVSCAVGGRSRTAVLALREAGYGGAVNVAGGIRAWIDAGNPVVVGSGPDPGPDGSAG